MRYVVIFLVTLAMNVGACESHAPKGKDLALAPIGYTDSAMVERVRAFVEENLRVKTVVTKEREPQGKTLSEEAEALIELVGSKHVAVVGLLAPQDDSELHGTVLYSNSVAVVNVTAVKPAEDDREKYGRRLERLAMKSFGMLLDNKPCPNPRCALCPYEKLEELDMRGRNFCPPCQGKTGKYAAKIGLQKAGTTDQLPAE